MPAHPSLLPTIIEVDESLYLVAHTDFLSRSPSLSSRKRPSPDPEMTKDLWSQMISLMDISAYQVPVESLQAILTPEAMDHWKRLRGKRCAA